MQLNGVEPDESVLVSTLSACTHLGALDTGYAVNGEGESALKLFTEMENGGIRPYDITFISIFTACNHSGLPREGLRLLYKMLTEYKIEPKSEHYGCIVDLLCQAGYLEEAKEILVKVPRSGPFEEVIAWRALLQACCKQGNSQMAEFAAERLVQLECHSGAYVLLSNLYAVAEKQDEVPRIRKLMTSRGVYKAPSCSSIQLNGGVYEYKWQAKTLSFFKRATVSTLDGRASRDQDRRLKFLERRPSIPSWSSSLQPSDRSRRSRHRSLKTLFRVKAEGNE
ncbi:hypothetical protein NL676_005869 [Syzygium grande]|nr:hypothetical protein NL676_005869 [Syzygium grande]